MTRDSVSCPPLLLLLLLSVPSASLQVIVGIGFSVALQTIVISWCSSTKSWEKFVVMETGSGEIDCMREKQPNQVQNWISAIRVATVELANFVCLRICLFECLCGNLGVCVNVCVCVCMSVREFNPLTIEFFYSFLAVNRTIEKQQGPRMRQSNLSREFPLIR